MCDYPCWPRQRRSPVHSYVYIHQRGVDRRTLTRRKGQKKAPKRLKGLNRCQSHNRRTFSYGASAAWHGNGSATSRTSLAAVNRFCLKTLEGRLRPSRNRKKPQNRDARALGDSVEPPRTLVSLMRRSFTKKPASTFSQRALGTAMAPSIDVARRRVRLHPRDPDFVNDPYPAYAAIREAAPAFFWEDYGFWCFARFADVSALLRDRRFGRKIVERPRGAKPHLAPFDALERHSMLELKPPEHTRLRNLVNRAFVSRRIEKLAPQIADLAHERIEAFSSRGSADLVAEFANPIPVAVIGDLLGVPSEMGPQLVDWSHRMVAIY